MFAGGNATGPSLTFEECKVACLAEAAESCVGITFGSGSCYLLPNASSTAYYGGPGSLGTLMTYFRGPVSASSLSSPTSTYTTVFTIFGYIFLIASAFFLLRFLNLKVSK